MSSINLDKTILVVAHPDDEILWFSSIVDKVAEVVICFLELDSNPTLSNGRKKALANYPLKNTSCLEIPESNIFNDENWKPPMVSSYGLQVTGRRHSIDKYKKNYSTLKHALHAKLAEYDHVFTHNPWGEYGHEEHIQLFRVIKDLQAIHNFSLWFPNYVSNKSYSLLFSHMENFNTAWVSYPTPSLFTLEVKALYEQNKCWTWYQNWQWPAHDIFISEKETTDQHYQYGNLFPLNLVDVQVAGPHKEIEDTYYRRLRMKTMNQLKALFRCSHIR